LWGLQKRVPFLEGHSQVLVYVSKFMMEVVPLTKKSKTMDPKDPVAMVKTYLQKLT
jgi:WASH complex subunit 7